MQDYFEFSRKLRNLLLEIENLERIGWKADRLNKYFRKRVLKIAESYDDKALGVEKEMLIEAQVNFLESQRNAI